MPDSKVEVKAVPVYVEEALCKWFSEDPCFLCGYNGEGYYQPNAHSCAKHYHSMTLSKLWNTRPIANNGVSLEEFRMHVLNVLKKRFPHVGEKSYENIKDAQDEIVAKLQPPRGGGEELAINELAQYLQMKDYEHFEKKGNVLTTFQLAEETIKAGYRKEVSGG